MKWLIGLALVLVLLAAPFVGAVGLHNWQLSRLQESVGALSHPAGSSLVARHGDIDNFGNGNHLDYWAVELRSFSGSRAVLQKGYRGLRVPVPNSDDDDFTDVKNGTQPVEIEFLPSPLPRNFHVRGGDNHAWNLARFAGKRGLYIVQVVNSGQMNGTIFDWRSL